MFTSICDPQRLSPDKSLHLLGLSVHAGLPWIAGHLGHGEDEEGDASEEEQDESGAGAGEGPAVVVVYPNRVLALDHAFDRLPHHLQRDERTQPCKCEEHASRFEEVVPFLTSARA